LSINVLNVTIIKHLTTFAMVLYLNHIVWVNPAYLQTWPGPTRPNYALVRQSW